MNITQRNIKELKKFHSNDYDELIFHYLGWKSMVIVIIFYILLVNDSYFFFPSSM